MQTCILTLVIILASQLSGFSDDRYPSHSEISPSSALTQSTAAQNPTPTAGNIAPATSVPATSIPPTGVAQPGVDPMRVAAPRTPGTTPSRLSKITKPADLFKTLTQPAGSEKLTGMPLTLAAAIQNTSSRARQTQRVALYWELSKCVADYYLTAQEAIELRALQGGISRPNELWLQTQQTTETRKQVALNAVKVAQLRLQKTLGSGNTVLPLPVDTPLCGAYETRYDQIFNGRTSQEAQQLSELLPLRYEELELQATSATAAREWLLTSSNNRSLQDDGTLLLKAYEQLALQRRNFVATAYQYNAEIVRYTELAVPQNVNTRRLVAMLIPTNDSLTGGWQQGSIRRTSAEEENPLRNGQPRTYAERKATTQSNSGSGSEHSIVVEKQ